MLAAFQHDVIKIDMALTRAVNSDLVQYEIVRAVIDLGATLHVSVVAEGVETIVLNPSFGAPPQSSYWDDPLNQTVMAAWRP